MTGQTRIMSLLEASANTMSGFALSWVAGLFIYPLFGASFTVAQNTGISLIYTAISLGRSYCWRRLFNRGR